MFTVTAANLPYSYRPGCPVPPSRLRMVHVSYLGFDGREHIGRIVVAANRTWQIIAVFHSLYLQRFPIASMRTDGRLRGSDAASMAANNTSAFNCRAVTGRFQLVAALPTARPSTSTRSRTLTCPAVPSSLRRAADYLDRATSAKA